MININDTEMMVDILDVDNYKNFSKTVNDYDITCTETITVTISFNARIFNKLVEEVDSDNFKIVGNISTFPADLGTWEQNDNTITWHANPETTDPDDNYPLYKLTFDIKPSGANNGQLSVNESLTLSPSLNSDQIAVTKIIVKVSGCPQSCDVKLNPIVVNPEVIPCNNRNATVTFSYNVPDCSPIDDLLASGSHDDCACPTSIELTGTVTSNFMITSVTGEVTGLVVTGDTFTWTIVPTSDTLYSLPLKVKYIGDVAGGTDLPIFTILSFDEADITEMPTVDVADCSEECITIPVDDSLISDDFTINCDDAAEIDFTEQPYEMRVGRTVVVRNVKVKNVCPDKSLAVGIILYETFTDGRDPVFRGSKSILVAPQEGSDCTDLCFDCLYFTVPEETPSLCNTRYFTARVIAHHADSDLNLSECAES